MENRLAIDVREACRKQKTGKGQFTIGLVDELLRRRMPLTLVTDDEIPLLWKNHQCVVVQIAGRGLRWHCNTLRWLRRNPGVTYLSPVSYIVPTFAPRSVRTVTVVHDLIAFLGEPHDRKALLIERILLPLLLRRKASRSHICTSSDATKRDLLARYPSLAQERITSIFAGPMHPHPERNVPDRKTILCVATLCPRKNQLRLIEAFASLPEKLRSSHQLILAGGRGWSDQPIIDAARKTPGVEWRGYIDDATYASLLHTCTLFALPSLYEGFGMQILDAMQRGIPVLTSNRGSLCELAEGAACIVDPESVKSIAAGLTSILTDEALRSRLRTQARERAELYSWRRTVDLFVGCL